VSAARPPAPPDVLARIVARTREAVERRRRELPAEELRRRAAEAARRRHPWAEEQRLRGALSRRGMSVIAEFKRRSPSAGDLRDGASVREIVSAYARGGAAALSVLTEEEHFGGSLDDLREARAACDLPILRKDFVVDPYQLHEAVEAGADAVLLIVAALDDAELRDLNGAARALGLEVLVEVHDRAELARALAVEPVLLGINNRDLRDFSVDVARTLELLADVPEGVLVVAESGISGPDQLAELATAGVSAVLVGESLMRAEDPEQALAALLGR
jgi:indole-3-glycerol phosphate synthase